MIDRLFLSALTFCLLAAATLAIGSALFAGHPPAAQQTPAEQASPVVQLPRVEVTGKRTDTGTAWAQTEASEPATRKLQ